MFVGHLAAALTGKTASRGTSLVWLVAAANLVDLIWPLLLLAGIERVRIDPGNTAFTPLAFEWYPWTHSLAMGVVWGIALAAVARAFGVAASAARLIGALVVSHWVLDFLTHRPDLPLWPWSDRVYGLGLWQSIAGTFAVEALMWLTAIALFLRVRRPLGVRGQLALWSFVIVSTSLWAISPFTPPPPSERAVAWFGLFGWIVVPWAWWIERTSAPRTGSISS
jgi:membrane-bound metal-dependent hydrolase YbcI (DUF457 family)